MHKIKEKKYKRSIYEINVLRRNKKIKELNNKRYKYGKS